MKLNLRLIELFYVDQQFPKGTVVQDTGIKLCHSDYICKLVDFLCSTSFSTLEMENVSWFSVFLT